MATLYISEYARLATDAHGQSVMAGLEPSRDQTMTITGSSTQCANAFGARFVQLHTDATCCVAFGPAASATAALAAPPLGSKRLVAGQTQFFGVNIGDVVAVIAST